MKNESFYIAGFWRFQWSILLVSMFVALAAMMTIEASLLPIHWNVYGDADRFADKNLALALWPLIIFALILIMKVIPKLEKRKDNLKQSKKATSYVLGGVGLLMLSIQLLSIFFFLGLVSSIMHWVMAFMSLLMIVVGNFLTKVQPNYSVGIRTKWTLNNDLVWKKTHRFASLLFILMGVISLSTLFWMPVQWLFINVVLFVIVAIKCVVYSYLIRNIK